MNVPQPIPDKPNFEPPSNWGNSTIPTPTPKLEDSLPLTTPTQETKTSYFKIFLIGFALILLGVLVGVIAAKVIPVPVSDRILPPVPTQALPSPADISEPTPTMAPVVIPAPTATPEALLKLNWKNYSAQSYKLFYPSTWVLKYTPEKLTLTKGKYIITISTSGENVGALCDEASIGKIQKSDSVWDVQKSEASASTFYVVCDSAKPITSIGLVVLSGDGVDVDQNTVDEFKLILEKIEIKPNAPLTTEEQG